MAAKGLVYAAVNKETKEWMAVSTAYEAKSKTNSIFTRNYQFLLKNINLSLIMKEKDPKIRAENDPSTHLPTGREERSVAGVPRHSEMPEKFARWLEIFHVMDTKGDVFGR